MGSITQKNPIVCTSCVSGLVYQGMAKVDKLYWHQPTSAANSLLVTDGLSGKVHYEMTVEASGESQVIQCHGEWKKDMFLRNMPCGTFYVYLK